MEVKEKQYFIVAKKYTQQKCDFFKAIRYFNMIRAITD